MTKGKALGALEAVTALCETRSNYSCGDAAHDILAAAGADARSIAQDINQARVGKLKAHMERCDGFALNIREKL